MTKTFKATETTLVHEADLPVFDERTDEPASSTARSSALALVGDVEVRLEARLGSALTSIDRLMKFSPGTVVALDRHVEDTIEITLNNRPVARGMIVAVGENFGVRISEILDTVHEPV